MIMKSMLPESLPPATRGAIAAAGTGGLEAIDGGGQTVVIAKPKQPMGVIRHQDPGYQSTFALRIEGMECPAGRMCASRLGKMRRAGFGCRGDQVKPAGLRNAAYAK